jgi:hypothetical protein
MQGIFDLERFMPHGMCFLWQPALLGMHVVADLAIAIAYFSIPFTIVYLLRRRGQSVPYRWVFGMFALFILLCGTTHLMNILVIWYPLYYLEGIVKIATDAASLSTALMVFPLVPTLLERFAHLGRLEALARRA